MDFVSIAPSAAHFFSHLSPSLEMTKILLQVALRACLPSWLSTRWLFRMHGWDVTDTDA